MDQSSRIGRIQSRVRRIIGISICALVALVAVASEDDQEYRHEVMEAIGAHATALRSILQEKVPHRDHIKIHVNALADLASIAHTLFPEGSEGGEALPAIWEKPEEFKKAVERFQTATAELRDVVNENKMDEMQEKVMAMFMACKGCHDDYRE